MTKKILHLNTETVQLKFVQNLGLSNSNGASEVTSYKHLRISTQHVNMVESCKYVRW